MNEPTYEVLLIEDNHDDIFLMRRAVRKAGMPWNLTVVTDGQEALDYVAGIGKFSVREQHTRPTLIFLDLKLPYVSGFDVLASIRAHQILKEIPVVILSSSPEDRDQKKAMELGANIYRLKPPSEQMLREMANDFLIREMGESSPKTLTD